MTIPNQGLPPLDPAASCMSKFEFLHPIIFYAPIVVYALGLMIRYRSVTLPALANPNIFAGGAVGERKSDVLKLAGHYTATLIAPYIVVSKSNCDDTFGQSKGALKDAQLSYPLVAKPETGLRGAGVRPIKNDADLIDYISEFPDGRDIMLQKKIAHAAEAGVFYIRRPGEDIGEIFSLTLKYRTTLTGDGTRTLQQLILACPRCAKMYGIFAARHKDKLDLVLGDGEAMALNFAGNHARGAIFRNGERHITPAMTAAFDAAAKDFPDLHFARFDVRFSSLEDLKAGKEFSILEVNGVGSEATHIWDCNMRLRDAYKVLAQQWRYAFEIGAANRARQHTPPSIRQLGKIWIQELLRADEYPLAH